ncbi:MAG: ABC transporter substrate-binding protein, partial [Pseudomonadota bacterium]|nr:ABC transporter substrate-binding protein [Pseudomonadota bacterium]
PTGGMTPSPAGAYDDPALEARLPYDPAAAKKLLSDAGYANGFDVQLDCPNDRYVNDAQICTALASMWAQIKVNIKFVPSPKALYFPKLEKYDFSMYMLGWGGAITDAETTLTPVMRNNLGEKGVGFYNYGHARDDKFDALAAQSSVEADAKKREQLIKSALAEYKEQFLTLPLHRQVIPWAARANVNVVHRADNWLEVGWVTVGK